MNWMSRNPLIRNLSVLLTILIAGQPIWTAMSFAQGPPQEIVTPNGTIVIPGSGVENPGDAGNRAHTNHLILAHPQKGNGRFNSAPVGETPGSLACVYGTSSASIAAGCAISGDPSLGNNSLPNAYNSTKGNAGSGAIAIVDAYDYPTAENDLNVYSSQFGLPACTTANGCFSKVYASGSKPNANCGWAQEEALDIEMAHAMAPGAKIFLVEAASTSYADLLAAVDVASTLVASNGGGQVSMSWGGSEFSSENTAAYESHFTRSGVVYFAASGDTGGKTIWPGTSPNVVSAGGTSINRTSAGAFSSESAWSGSGGGPSKYEARPSYQNPISALVGNFRGAPDFSFDANPNTGVFVYDSTSCGGSSGWLIFGGTSVASPALAGIVNLAGSANAGSSSASELGTIYSICGSGPASSCSNANFRDITSGTAGSFSTKAGWDFVTGVGSSIGLLGK